MSPDAWAAQKQSTMPKFYFDLEAAKEYLSIGQTPWTPNLSALYGLNLALDQMLSEVELDAVVNTTPDSFHKDIAIKVLLSEKF